jgi:D-tyrosyl-tRNA(Tyr) deacylase
MPPHVRATASYIRAARPEHAVPLYEQFIENLEILTSKKVASGVFGAMMDFQW